MRARAKVWLEDGGRMVFGEGAYQLLAGIRRHGSLSGAAGELRMSYRMAWGVIRKLEGRLGYPLVESRVGGEEGGGTVLTRAGEELLERFAELQRRVDGCARAAFAELFGGSPGPPDGGPVSPHVDPGPADGSAGPGVGNPGPRGGE